MTNMIDIETLKKKVNDAFEKIRPALIMDGGDAEIKELTPDGRLTITFKGACDGCPMAAMTLKQGIERYIKSQVPEIVSVDAVPR